MNWPSKLQSHLPARARLRAAASGLFVRMPPFFARVRPAALDELSIRAFAPGLFGRCLGVIPAADGLFLIERAQHGQLLHRAGSEARYLQLALTVWALHCAGHTPDDVEPGRMLATDGGLKLLALPARGVEARAATALAWARALMTGRRATAGLRADRLAPLVLRVLGGDSAGPAMLRARMAALADVDSWRAAAQAWVTDALRTEVPRIITAADTEQGAAIHALVCEAAIRAGVAAGDGPVFGKSLRLIGPVDAVECERRLGRLSPSPTIAIVTGAPLDVARELEHVGTVLDQPALSARGLFEWLRPLGVQPSLAVEELVPVLEREPLQARQGMSALIERAGAVITDDGPRLDPGWLEHWQASRGQRGALSVLEPDAARVAHLLALSPGGLDAAAIAQSQDHKRGAAMLEDIGLAARVGGVLRPGEGTRAAAPQGGARRALLLWLAEREFLSPEREPARRDAWRIGLRLRAGDLACWHDDNAEKLFHVLVESRAYDAALQLAESHAAGALRAGAGPPSVDVLYATRDLATAMWKPRRHRRLLRAWLRGYGGEWRALALALLAHVERKLSGADSYGALIEEIETLCDTLPRFPREQALIEAAHVCSYDNPARALQLLTKVGAEPARKAGYLCEARILRVRAECEFVQIRIEQSYALVQQAREKLHLRAPRLARARLEAEIEARHMMNHSMLTFYKADPEVLLQPLRKLQAEHGCVADILRSAIVNDTLMRMRTWEVGLATPEQMDGVLAEARPENLRGYLVVMFQLEENAVYRGDIGVARQISARIAALHPARDGDQTVHSGWKRHDALRHAYAGDWREALACFRDSRSWHIPAPWGPRTRMLRRGEWGLLLMHAGKWRQAARALQDGYDSLAAISAGGRGSTYLAGLMLCDAMLGLAPAPAHASAFEGLVKNGYILPRMVKLVLDAHAGALPWSTVIERIEELAAPEFWKACTLSFAAALARLARAPSASHIARAARERSRPEWSVLCRWLDDLSPSAQTGPQLPAQAASAILEMQTVDGVSLAQLACITLARATGSPAAAQIGFAPAAMSDGAELGPLLERALLGDEVATQDGCALALSSPFGALACAARDAAPVLQAVARRLSELSEIAQSRVALRARKRQGRDAVRAAWALAAEDASPASRLGALRALVVAETSADDAAVSVLRGTRELLTSGALARWDAESAHPIDSALHLRVRTAGGDSLQTAESAGRAARVMAAMLQRSPERLRLELSRPADDEAVTVAGEELGVSEASRRLLDDLRRFADIDLPVCVIGEPGSGKDLAVRALHAMSARAPRPLVVADCPTLRRETAASELFGHVRGAFTGATQDHVGLLERAADGMLQLDGIAHLDMSIQAMLLRAFQARSFLPVGGVRERELNARLAVTSDRSLDQLVHDGLLREDLAQRLQGVSLHVPPLRDRGDDAVRFARTLLQRLALQFNRRLRLSHAAEKYLLEHHWPGNMRELRSTITRAAVMSGSEEVGLSDLAGPDVGGAHAGMLLPADAADLGLSARLVLGTLRQLGRGAAGTIVSRLGLSRTTVSTCLSQLSRKGLCERIGQGRSTQYRAL